MNDCMPLTVAHIMPWSGMGGVEIATLRLVESTRSRIRHVAFCLPDAHELQAAFKAMNVETLEYTPPTPSLRHGLRFLAESRVVTRALRAARVDIVHFAETKAALHNSLAARLSGARLLCHVRVDQPRLPIRERLLLLLIERFLFVSEQTRETFALAGAARSGSVLYDAVQVPEIDVAASNRSVREEFGIAMDAPVVAMIARVSPQKDYFTLASAARQVLAQRPETRFLIIGDNELVPLNREHFRIVRSRLDELGILSRFLFTGHRGDVPRLTCAADLCVLSTHREGFPLSILEAMSLGKPVVATEVGGIAEIVRPGVNGYLHAHENADELAAAMLRLIEDPVLTRRLGEQACARVRADFSVEAYSKNILEIYEQL